MYAYNVDLLLTNTCNMYEIKILLLYREDQKYSKFIPHMVKHIESIGGVQRRATKMIPELKHLSYPERLKKTKVTNHGIS